ncbi:MAG: hypothetical protein CMK32_10995 [Porticoccaceae bacterium]|nr:hypothetical protein [Porticoccaceae bacterium]
MESITVAITGAGGAGAISSGELLLRLAGRQGYFGMLKKTFSPQIRGGESAAILRLSPQPVETFDGVIHLLIALDWHNFARFSDEVPISAETLVVQDVQAGTPPDNVPDGAETITIDGAGVAAGVESGWVNMVFVGLMARVLGSDVDTVEALVAQRFRRHPEATGQAAVRAARAGFSLTEAERLRALMSELRPTRAVADRWLANGNQLAGLGALEAGIRFVAAYPITPASDVLEWLAGHLEASGGNLVQAEDELAAINMVIGAGFGGVPAMTATSGPGLALMSEGMGLAVASETPVLVLNVMRGGPSTGIPTKSEQSDFNLAVYGLHGDAPHVVLACQSVADCYHTTAWGAALASELQTLVIVLSDQFLGQSMQILDAPETTLYRAERFKPADSSEVDGYRRYRDTASGISPMAVPGDAHCMYTADGLEHTESAVPSPRAGDHQRQLDKRQRKIAQHDFGDSWYTLVGSARADTLLICFGAVTASAREALTALATGGRSVALLSFRLLCPLPLDQLEPILTCYERHWVVEQNHSGQFCHYLRSLMPAVAFRSLARQGPLLITPREIVDAIVGDSL